MKYHVPPGGRGGCKCFTSCQCPKPTPLDRKNRCASMGSKTLGICIVASKLEAGFLQQRFKGKSCLVSTANLPETCTIGHIYLKLSSTFKIAQIQERLVCLF